MTSPKRPKKDPDYLQRQEAGEAIRNLRSLQSGVNAAIARAHSKLDDLQDALQEHEQEVQTNGQLLLQYLRNDKRTREGFCTIAWWLQGSTVVLSAAGAYNAVQTDDYRYLVLAVVSSGVSYACHRWKKRLRYDIGHLDSRIANVEAEMSGVAEDSQAAQKLGTRTGAVSANVAELADMLTYLAPDNDGKPKKLD